MFRPTLLCVFLVLLCAFCTLCLDTFSFLQSINQDGPASPMVSPPSAGFSSPYSLGENSPTSSQNSSGVTPTAAATTPTPSDTGISKLNGAVNDIASSTSSGMEAMAAADSISVSGPTLRRGSLLSKEETTGMSSVKLLGARLKAAAGQQTVDVNVKAPSGRRASYVAPSSNSVMKVRLFFLCE